MEHLWPWVAVAAAGTLHGLNPATGWIFAACDSRLGGRSHAKASVLPIALGHLAALAAGALAVPAALQLGLDIDRLVLPVVGAGLLLVLAAHCWRGLAGRAPWRPSGAAGIALCSFVTSTAHGAGWMLVPALIPFCATDLPGREISASGSTLLVLAAVALHMTAMLATTAVATLAARRAFAAGWRWLKGAAGAPGR